MTEEVPAAPSMPECNGSVPPEKGPLQLIGIVDEIAKSVGTGPYANAETSPDAPLAKENLEETRNSLAEDVMRGDFDGEKQCEGKREENAGTLQQGAAEIQDAGADGHESEEAPASPGCNSQAEKLGEQPSLGKKNDISRHSYSRYNTISYRRIRKGNTKQRIDEFESMMHL
nr:PREDICTED: ermin [Opisthocomus hoazin]